MCVFNFFFFRNFSLQERVANEKADTQFIHSEKARAEAARKRQKEFQHDHIGTMATKQLAKTQERELSVAEREVCI